MKTFKIIAVCACLTMVMPSCKVFNSMTKSKTGCGTNGKNVGAEKLASGDPEAVKAARKAKKFKS